VSVIVANLRRKAGRRLGDLHTALWTKALLQDDPILGLCASPPTPPLG
jgi:hypothetical protein